MTETDYPERRSITKRGRISELLAAIALALALILVVDTSTSHGGTGFLGMSQEQTGQILGAASIVLFFSAFV
jgi:hypothetical protein